MTVFIFKTSNLTMLIKRLFSLTKHLRNKCPADDTEPALKALEQHHSSEWNYRCAPPPPSNRILLLSELVGGFAWWWVLWHCWTEPGHIFGEFPYPDPKKWTNEELFIPKEYEKYSDVQPKNKFK